MVGLKKNGRRGEPFHGKVLAANVLEQQAAE